MREINDVTETLPLFSKPDYTDAKSKREIKSLALSNHCSTVSPS